MIILNRKSIVPLYEQIYRYISNEIIKGRLKEGTRLTATRVMASNLDVGRNTIERAYLQLCDEGYLENKIGSGYYVKYFDMNLASSLEIKGIENHGEKLSKEEKSEVNIGDNNYKFDLKYGNISMKDFPITKWKKALNDAVLHGDGSQFTTYCKNNGSDFLINQIINYLYKSRGVSCEKENLVIGAGTQFLVGIICDILKKEYNIDKVAIEDPGFDGVRSVFQNQNYKIIPVPVDEDGINIEYLKKTKAKVVYVTPSHQFPTGAVLSIQKKIELIKWANDNNGFIIEDDYDSELRYGSQSIPAMQGLDKSGRVIYLGTFSKILSPSLRVGYVVIPENIRKIYNNMFYLYHNTVPDIIQNALGIFMTEGNWNTHTRKICIANKRKHNKLVDKIKDELGEFVIVKGKGAGLHIILESRGNLSESQIIEKGESVGLKLYPVSRYWIEKHSYKYNQVMVGFGGIDFSDINEVVSLMKKIFV